MRPVPESVAPSSIVTVEPRSDPATESVPADTLVAPVRPEVPVRVSMPAPVLVKLPSPSITLAKLALLAWSMMSAPSLSIRPVPKLCAVPLTVPSVIVVPPL